MTVTTGSTDPGDASPRAPDAPATVAIRLGVNGRSFDLQVEPRELLVDVVRERLGLTGTKVGCDTGQCGACVLELDGVTVKGCAVLAVQADGADVVTIEGLGEPGTMQPLQVALQAAHAVQCGFCTPGMVMSLTELLERRSQPTEVEVREALTGNLCRCTGYENVVNAVGIAVQLRESRSHLIPTTELRRHYDRLLASLAEGDAEATVDGCYHEDAVLTTFDGIHTGRAALVEFYRAYFRQREEMQLVATERVAELGDALYTESLLRTPSNGVVRTYTAYVFRDGRISHHFAGTK